MCHIVLYKVISNMYNTWSKCEHQAWFCRNNGFYLIFPLELRLRSLICMQGARRRNLGAFKASLQVMQQLEILHLITADRSFDHVDSN